MFLSNASSQSDLVASAVAFAKLGCFKCESRVSDSSDASDAILQMTIVFNLSSDLG